MLLPSDGACGCQARGACGCQLLICLWLTHGTHSVALVAVCVLVATCATTMTATTATCLRHAILASTHTQPTVALCTDPSDDVRSPLHAPALGWSIKGFVAPTLRTSSSKTRSSCDNWSLRLRRARAHPSKFARHNAHALSNMYVRMGSTRVSPT